MPAWPRTTAPLAGYRETDAVAQGACASRTAPRLGRLRPGRAGDHRRRPAGRSRCAPRRPQSGAAEGRHPRRRAAPRRRRRGHRQDPGDHAADRLAHRDAAGEAVGDPRPHVHGEGRGGDAGQGRSARPVRLHGRRDRDVPRVRRPDHPRVRPRARPADRRPGPDPGGGRDLPPGAPVRIRPRSLSAPGRPDADSSGRWRRSSAAARTRTSRRRPTSSTRTTLAARADAMPDDEAVAEEARRQGELARAYGRYQELLAANGFIDFGDQVNLALRLVRTSAAARLELQSRFRFVLVDEFQDTNRAQSELVSILAEPHRNVTVVGDDDQSIYKFRGAAISNILGFRDRYPDARTVVLRRNYRSLAPILDASYRLVRFNDPDRLEVRAGISKRLRPERQTGGGAPPPSASRRSRPTPRKRTGSRRRSVAGSPRARGRATSPSSSAPTATRTRFCAASTSLGSRGGSPARPGSMPGRRSAGCSPSCARSRTSSSSVDVYALAVAEPYGLGGEDLTAIVNTARRRHRSVWEVLDELERQPGILRLSPATRDRRLALRRGHAPVHGARPRQSGRGGPVSGSCATRGRSAGSRPPTPSRPRRRSGTSPGSSTSSGPSRRSCPTTGRSSSLATSRRSSRPATTRRPPISTPMPTRSPS